MKRVEREREEEEAWKVGRSEGYSRGSNNFFSYIWFFLFMEGGGECKKG